MGPGSVRQAVTKVVLILRIITEHPMSEGFNKTIYTMNLSCVFELDKIGGHLTTCADSESIVRGGPSLTWFFQLMRGVQIPYKWRFAGGLMMA